MVQKLSVRVRAWWDDLRDSLWVLPTLTVAVSVAAAVGLVAIEEQLPDAVVDVAFGGTPEGARAVLSELAGATFTVTGVVFSLTIVALQMASSQFTPRLLRTFLRDRRTQTVLSGMVGSGVFDVTVLRSVRSGEENGVGEFVPQVAVSAALLYALVAVGLLVFFLHHLARHMRVDVVMDDIRRESLTQLRSLEPRRDTLPDMDGPQPADGAVPVPGKTAGYLQTVDAEILAARAVEQQICVRLRPAMGTWVSAGTTIAWVWDVGGGPPRDREAASTAVHGALHLGPDRTESADLAFGLRQLADIAVRALSTGVNDPTTAVQALGQLSSILVELAGHPLGSDLRRDDDGRIRAIVPRADFGSHLDLAVEQIRRYGSSEPAVLVAVCELLMDVAEHVADSADRVAAVNDQLERTAAANEVGDQAGRGRVEAAIDAVRAALEAGHRRPRPTEAA